MTKRTSRRLAAPGIDEVIVVVPDDLIAEAGRILGNRYGKVRDIIAGGSTRPGSTRRAIDLLSQAHPGQDCNVLFHDAARPLVDQRIIADCVAGLGQDLWPSGVARRLAQVHAPQARRTARFHERTDDPDRLIGPDRQPFRALRSSDDRGPPAR